MSKSKSTTAYNLGNIINMNNADQLKIPTYQRGQVWSKYQKQLLIDSILRDIDIPKLYFDVKNEGNGEVYEVVDGQQRIGAIVEFLDNQFSIMQDADPVNGQEIKGKLYSQLPTTVQIQKLQNYNLDIVLLREYSQEDVKEMFVRLQEGAPLNAAEKRRALPGNIPAVVEALSGRNLFTTEHVVGFSEIRFAFEDRAAKILHQFIKGEISAISPSEIKSTYMDNQELNPEANVVKDIRTAMNFLHSALKDKSPKLMKWGVLRLVYLANEMLKEFNLNQFKQEFGDAWIAFELGRKADREKEVDEQDPLLVEFSNCARGDSLAGQRYLHDHLKREFVRRLPKLKVKDRARSFSEDQRWVLFQNSSSKCEANTESSWYSADDCEGEIAIDNFHADHIEPHSAGGATSIDNGQALCVRCNQKKSDSV
jgi:hypothetical protein